MTRGNALSRELFLAMLVVAVCFNPAQVPAGQTQTPYKVHIESNQLQAPIHAESNLVLVPVFVLDRDHVMRRRTFAEIKCSDADDATFFSLLPSQPYTPHDCLAAEEVRGLAAQDFRLLENGVEQRIQRVCVEGWWLPVRDNLTWHYENSVTATGVWSTSDIGLLSCSQIERYYWGNRRDASEVCRRLQFHEAWDTPGGAPRYFYSLAYVPSNPEPGCHPLKVEVDRPGAMVFARDQYCAGQSPSDSLYGTECGAQLEHDLALDWRGKIRLELQAGYFFTDKGNARVQVALEFRWQDLYYWWDTLNEVLHAAIAVLGAAYERDGAIAGRFSDRLYPSYWPTFLFNPYVTPAWLAAHPDAAYDVKSQERWKDPFWIPAHYETQLNLSPGTYDLRVALGDTEKFGIAAMPLHIDNYAGKALGLSSVMLCKRCRDAHVAAVERAAANFAPQYVPLVSKNIEVTPDGDTHFKKGQLLIPYFEIYEPLLTNAPTTKVQAQFRIVETKTGQVRDDFTADAQSYEQAGKTVIPMTREVLTNKMPKGAYRLEVQATDSAGNSTPWRSANFTVE